MKKRIGSAFLALAIALSALAPVQGKSLQNPPRTMANLVVFARFQDDDSDEFNQTVGERTVNSAIRLLYDDSSPLHDGVDMSMKRYLKDVSFGQFQVENRFCQPVDDQGKVQTFVLSQPRSSYTGDYAVLEEIIAGFNDGRMQIETNWQLDYNEAGIIDNLTVILQGSTSGRDDALMWPHKANADNDTPIRGKYRVSCYNFLNSATVYSSTDNAANSQQGVLIHEFLHSAGLPDLYNLGERKDVGIFDIMSQSSRYPSYLLAYNRQQMGWIDIDEISDSGSYTLDRADKAGGNQAYIIRSPLSSGEFFVVEYRTNLNRRGDTTNLSYGFDRLYNPGLVVYRVNQNIPATNMGNEPYIYVFRPGESGPDRGDGDLICAALAPDSGPGNRQPTSLGSADLAATTGTIYYANGQNSGLVIDNLRISGDQLTFDLQVPDYGAADLWQTAGNAFGQSESTGELATVVWDGKLTAAYTTTSYQSGRARSQIEIHQFQSGSWQPLTTALAGHSGKLVVHQNQLYLFYLQTDGSDYLPMAAVLQNGSWKSLGAIAGRKCNYFDALSDGAHLYFVCDEYAGVKGYYLYEVDGERFSPLGSKATDSPAAVGLIAAEGKLLLACGSTDGEAMGQVLAFEYGGWRQLFRSSLAGTNVHLARTAGDTTYFLFANYQKSVLVSLQGGHFSETPLLAGQTVSSYDLCPVGDALYLSYLTGGVGKVAQWQEDALVPLGQPLAGSLSDLRLAALDGALYAGTCSQNGQITFYQKALPQAPPPAPSDNNYLASLRVVGHPLPFRRDLQQYTLAVANEVTRLQVQATPEDSGAQVCIDSPALAVGANTVTVTVTSASGLVRVYTVAVTRAQPSPPPLTEATLQAALAKDGIRVEESYIKGFGSASAFLATVGRVNGQGYRVEVRTAAGEAKDWSGPMKTRDQVICTAGDRTFRYTVVINGDVNGDGKVSAVDYLMIRDKIMGKLSLDDVGAEAANVNRDSRVSAVDYLMIKDSIMGKVTIPQ